MIGKISLVKGDMADLPEDVGGEPIEAYIRRFDQELRAIAEHTKTLTEEGGLIPKTLLSIETKMAEALKGVQAYEGRGWSRAEGITSGESGPTASATSGGRSTKDQQRVAKLLAPRSGPSPTASVGGSPWLERVEQNQGFRLPRYGELTVQDTLSYVSNFLANVANKQRQGTDQYERVTQLEKDKGLYDEAGNLSVEGQKAVTALENLPRSGGGRATIWGSNTFATLAGGYTGGKAFSRLLGQILNPTMSAQNLAYLSGYQGDSGFHGLHAGAVAAGLGQRASQIGFALGNNVSPDQAQQIYNNLFGLGWFGGSSTNAMRQGLSQITETNPLLGTNPQVAGMMDQATRMGQSSISQFVDVMKEVPAAANAAHVSLSQVVSDASALGQYYKSIGGTPMSGYQAATSFNAVSGLPAGIFQQLLQNPMVQGQVFMGSQLMPWEQGNASFGSQMGGIFNAMDLFKNAVHLPAIRQTDSIGLTREISGNDRLYSLMSHYYGIGQSAIKNMMEHQQGIMAGTNLRDNTVAYLSAVQSGQIKPNDPAWGKLFKQVMMARDWKGHPMFSGKQQQQILTAGMLPTSDLTDWLNKQHPHAGSYISHHHGFFGGLVHGAEDVYNTVAGAANAVPTPGHLPTINTHSSGFHWRNWQEEQQFKYQQAHHGASLSTDQLRQLALKDAQPLIAQKRADMIKNIISKHTQSINQGPQITIGLSGTAAKFFKLSSNTAQGKAKANAGGSSVNIPYGQGPSDAALSANPDTSGVSSNPTWGTSAGQSPNWETP